MAKWGSVDFQSLVDLRDRLEAAEKQSGDLCEKCAKELAARLLQKVIKRTPVGKVPKLGQRTTTRTGIGGKKYKLLTRGGDIYERFWAGYSGGELRRSWYSTKVRKVGNAYEITVYNNKEYAVYVEYGHRQQPGRYVPALGKRLVKSWVEGKYMLTKSVLELEKQAPSLLAKMTSQFLEEMLNGK